MDSVIASKASATIDQAHPGTKVFKNGLHVFVFDCRKWFLNGFHSWLLRLSTQASVLALGSGFLLFELELLETLRRCHSLSLSIF